MGGSFRTSRLESAFTCFSNLTRLIRCTVLSRCISSCPGPASPGSNGSPRSGRPRPEPSKLQQTKHSFREAVPPWFGRRMARHLEEEGANVTFQAYVSSSEREDTTCRDVAMCRSVQIPERSSIRSTGGGTARTACDSEDSEEGEFRPGDAPPRRRAAAGAQ